MKRSCQTKTKISAFQHSVVPPCMSISLYWSVSDVNLLYPPSSSQMDLFQSERSISRRFVFEQKSLTAASRDDYVAHAGRCMATHDASKAMYNKPSFAWRLGRFIYGLMKPACK